MICNLKIVVFFRVPKKEVPRAMRGTQRVKDGWSEGPVFGSFLNTFGDFFSKKVTPVYKRFLKLGG